MLEFNPYIDVTGYDNYEFIDGYGPYEPVRGDYFLTAADYYFNSDGTRGPKHFVKSGNYGADLAAPVGSPVQTIDFGDGTKHFLSTDKPAYSWHNDDKEWSVKSFSTQTGFIHNVKTKGSGYGYHINIKLESNSEYKSVTSGHMRPNSKSGNALESLREKAYRAGIDSVPIPAGTQIGEVGKTGLTTGPHLHHELEIR